MSKRFSHLPCCRFELILCLSLLALPAFADTAWQSVNEALVDQHLIPRYQRLAETTATLSKQAHAFCAKPDTESFESLRAAYHPAMDAWMGIQHMRFGPITFLLRHERFELWPDKHGTGARQMQRMLAEENRELLKLEQFAQQSVAVQGFSALERLLFPSSLHLDQFGHARAPSYRCDFLMAIADNLNDMAAGNLADWRPGKVDYRAAILGAEAGDDFFEGSDEVSSRLLNGLYTQLQVIVDQKLLLPMTERKARRAESWRSQRSLRNVRLNLLALQEMYAIEFAPMVNDPALDASIQAAFQATIDAANQIPSDAFNFDTSAANDAAQTHLLQSVRDLKKLIGSQLPPAVGLMLGFNSLDGD